MKNIYYNPHSRQQGELFHTKIGGLTSGASRGGTPPNIYIYKRFSPLSYLFGQSVPEQALRALR